MSQDLVPHKPSVLEYKWNKYVTGLEIKVYILNTDPLLVLHTGARSAYLKMLDFINHHSLHLGTKAFQTTSVKKAFIIT